jgi:DNA-binding transcriptional LysR family regulator
MALRIEDLDFAKLRAFQLVATHGTLGAAATQLGLTIPAISAKLKRLDEVLGVPLFKRLPNGLTLTPAGERFLRDLTPLLHDAEQALARVQAPDTARSGETGHITVAIGGDYAGFFMPRMHGFLVEFPRVELSMRVARRSDSLAALQAGKADFCMGVFPRLPQGIAAKVVARTTLSLVGRTEAEAEAEPVEGRRLIIAPRGTALRQVLRQSPHMEGRPNVLECPTCATALDLVRLGAGPAIVHTMCAPRTTDLYARDLGDRHGLMQVVVAYRRSTLRTRAAEAFYEHITG